MGARVHHSAINVVDLDASLRFYRDGLGFEVMMENDFDGDWPTLFGAASTTLHSVFLGDPAQPDSGIVELVSFAEMAEGPRTPDVPVTGFFLLSLYVSDVATVLDRIAGFGLGGTPHRIELPGPDGPVTIATVRDPNGVLVELIGL